MPPSGHKSACALSKLRLRRQWVTGEPGQNARLADAVKPELTGAAKRCQLKNKPPALEAYIEQIFADNDADGSGELCPDEIWWAFSSMGLGLSEGDLRNLVRMADKNGDG